MGSERVETVIVGGGQAGLATSYYLNRRGREHVVLEQAAQAGNAWRSGRWDSFTLVTPNWAFRLPGAEYGGDSPDAFMPRDEIVSRFERYVVDMDLPVHFDARVTCVEQRPGSGLYVVQTDDGDLEAKYVVIATGLFQRPKVSPLSAEIPAAIDQLHSGQYRNPAALRDGAVLVVGSAQSGSQIAQELYQSGRQVYLCVGSAGRVPRRYRGKDIFEWMYAMSYFDRTVDDLPSPRARFAPMPHVSGRDGGQSLNLHQYARDGVVLLGHLRAVDDGKIRLTPDRNESLAKADAFERELIGRIDAFIDRAGLDAPSEALPQLRDGYLAEEITDLDMASVGITNVVWATGYAFDFDFVGPRIFDADGYPVQRRGMTESAGLFFIGLPWLYKQKSGLLIGVGEDADYVAAKIDESRV
jgi:putative flavoprotein involved in K+ transport